MSEKGVEKRETRSVRKRLRMEHSVIKVPFVSVDD